MLVHEGFCWILIFVEFTRVQAATQSGNVTIDHMNTAVRRTYSAWSGWSACRGGSRTRRRHCLRRRICGDAVRIEVAGCGNSPLENENVRRHTQHRRRQHIQTADLKQLGDDDKHMHGYSQWGPWTACSKKCTSVRERHCQKWVICGRKVIRQSAYCYLEGSYCHHWIRHRARQDPGSPKTASQAIRADDSRSYRTLQCGRVGRYRGPPSARKRARMRDMMKIIGGRQAPPGKWTWQVAVLNRYKEAFCGGTLIALRWVVTAAHCVRRRLYVRLGEHDLLVRGHGEVEMRVAHVVIHPMYDPDTVVNDVALLRLPAPARPDLGHGVACLPQPHELLPPHTSCVILGWGKKRPTDVHGTRILHEAQVSTIQQAVCRRSYWQYSITDDMVCAGRGRRDSCAGDSGGPLLCRDRNYRYYLQGITSFGDGCGKRGKYGIYTRTAGYVTWIRDVMRKYYD
ncbi:chymotrypsinogen 2 [Aricia agestis]|uniref:chymotrypsinogen 2 n=1 Tax=Aricia agestis TaxID=91739 RepID=UPI001C205EA6|nr:chymotrypsinogen 2 [Aricia agestis]